MKKIFLLLIILVLTACDNPFKKYEESFDALTAALTMADKVDTINTIIDRIDNTGTVDYTQLTVQDIQDITASLEYINENLDNPQIQAILTSYAEQYDGETLLETINSIEIDSDIVNTNITGVTVEQKEEIITLLSNITEQLTKLYA